MKKWTIEDSNELYNIKGWGTSYFGINEKGDVYVTPCKDNTQIDLRDVMDELALRDITAPVLLRFPDILDNRIEKDSQLLPKSQGGIWIQRRKLCHLSYQGQPDAAGRRGNHIAWQKVQSRS